MFTSYDGTDTKAEPLLRSKEIGGWRKANSVQVNIPAESGEMGILAQHVPSIEQLKPGLVEVIEEAGGSKQFFCTLHPGRWDGAAWGLQDNG
jgi:hypothetical protein